MTLICNHAVIIDPSTFKKPRSISLNTDTNNNDDDEAKHFTVSDLELIYLQYKTH